MDLKIKLGKQTINLIDKMNEILNCNPDCQNLQISKDIPSNTISKTGMVKIGTLYFENKTFDFIKYFCTLFQANCFNNQLGYLRKLQIEGSKVKVSFEFTGLDNILEQMSNFVHLYKSDASSEVECNAMASRIKRHSF